MLQQNRNFERRDQHGNRGRSQDNRPTFNENVNDYIPIVSKLLNLDTIATDDLKTAIDKLEKSVIQIKNEGKDDQVKMHQIRNIFSLIKSAENQNDLTLLIPRLKYIGARQRGKSGRFFADLIVELITKINNDDQIKNLVYIVESIIAYHKFHITEKS